LKATSTNVYQGPVWLNELSRWI